MKLLSPQVLKDGKAFELNKDIIRIQELNAATEKARLNLANAEADFSSTLATQRERWAKEMLEHDVVASELKREIAILEAKKLNSLIPFNILKEGTDGRMLEAEEFVKNLHKREDDVEEIAELLTDKLDAVGQREQDVKRREQQVALREQGVTYQEGVTVLRSQQLSQRIIEFDVAQSKAVKLLEERKSAAFLYEQTLTAKAATQKRTDEEQNKVAIRLADERGVLDRAWQELKRKQGISP